MKTRFAPSPSGHLHVGGARTALFNFAFARRMGGRFILRIEDTDQKRSSDAASLGFLKDLAWLGILWDEGPEFAEGAIACGGGDAAPYFQSQRRETYDALLDRLLAEGKAYRAFDTPEELEAQRRRAAEEKRAFRYQRTTIDPATEARLLAEGRPHVLRLVVPQEPVTIVDAVLGEATIPAGEIDDFVLRKADGFPTYHFAVVVDDELMGVTHVLRAQEHFNNTARHMLIQDALGFRRPTYAHLSIIFNPDGSKMSKRDKDRTLRARVRDLGLDAPPPATVGAARFAAWLADANIQLELEEATRLAAALDVSLPEINVDDFRRSGYLPEVLVNFLALNGWSPGNDLEKFDLAFLCEHFSLERVLRTPAKFDRAKLLAFNIDAINALPRGEFVERARLHGTAFHPEFMERLTPAQFELLMNASHGRSRTLDEPFRGNRWLVTDDDALRWESSKPVRKAMTGASPNGVDHLRGVRPVLEALETWDVPAIETAVTGYAKDHAGEQVGKVAQPLRIAVTGGTVSPPIHDTLALLGKTAVLRRIARALDHGWEQS
ncbi:MAG TPA: glutamate--tRNA ligase [Phycisphaerales bacterium]|nr:glutamate--tRNA ligase [Phycisphaerales bacterium]HMP37620.1 glutamate--tRNA ligase [Phycisphaerales bacterium]